MKNVFVESFKRCLRDECFDVHQFVSLAGSWAVEQRQAILTVEAAVCSG
jgi:hypothetical protein